jgi:F-type H+-transporting ATPase subunit b
MESVLVVIVSSVVLASPILAPTDTAAASAAPAVESQAGEGGHGAQHAESPNPLTIGPDLAVFTAIVFLVLLAVLWKFAWGPIAEALDRREQGIAGQIQEARRSNEEAKRLLAEHQSRLEGAAEEVRGLLDQARREAETQKQEIFVEAQQAARAEKEQAVREIAVAKNQALRELSERSVDMALGLAGRIVGRQLSPADHAELIEQALPELPQKG